MFSESESSIPRRAVISGCLWAAGSALVVIEVILELAGVDHRSWAGVGTMGLFLGMGGATLSVRGYIIRATKCLSDREAEWERQAFDMGFDAGQRRASADVHPLR